ncbi:MAG TPA: hypothetical protein VGE01_00945 [Fimbriimonas sp.]
MREPPVSLLLLIFPFFWIALSWTISQLMGWARIARTYMAYHRPEGERYRGRSMEFGRWASYGNSVNATLSSEGIHLSMFPLFAIGHPPMIIPWSMVTGLKENVLFKSVTGLQVQMEVEGKQLKLYLPPRARPAVDRYTRGRFAQPERPAQKSPEEESVLDVIHNIVG